MNWPSFMHAVYYNQGGWVVIYLVAIGAGAAAAFVLRSREQRRGRRF